MPVKTSQSQHCFREAQAVLVGGVNSPVRAFRSVNADPVFIDKGDGAYLVDVDGNRYVDYVLSFGPLLLGHADPDVCQAIRHAAENGATFGAPTQLESELAEWILSCVPSMEKLRFVNSGTEAGMSAIRLARGVTNRKKIIKFEGCYHGHSDSLLVAAGSGALTHGQPDSLGVLASLAEQTIVLPYNDAAALERVFQEHGRDIACVILEVVAGNMGVILPQNQFLDAIQTACGTYESLLICDEVMTGFRMPNSLAQHMFGLDPDITMLGKVIGGGLPIGAFGGKKKVMSALSPEGGVYQAGTLSGNPVVMASGLATLKKIKSENSTMKANEKTSYLVEEIKKRIVTHGVPVSVGHCGSMFCLFFLPELPQNLAEVTAYQSDTYNAFHHHLLNEGIYTPPSQFEALFMSAVHDNDALEKTIRAIDSGLKAIG